MGPLEGHFKAALISVDCSFISLERGSIDPRRIELLSKEHCVKERSLEMDLDRRICFREARTFCEHNIILPKAKS